MTNAVTAKLAKNQTTCFHCRKVVLTKDIQWVDWSSMQVRLCPSCERTTVEKPERSKGSTRG